MTLAMTNHRILLFIVLISLLVIVICDAGFIVQDSKAAMNKPSSAKSADSNSQNPSGSDNSNSQNLYIVVVIPLIVAIIGAAGLWTFIQARWNGFYFQKLILREIEELYPYPPTRNKANCGKRTWVEHFEDRKFIHKCMFDAPQDNQEYILSLRPDLVYFVTQLWQEIELLRREPNRNTGQFDYYWKQIIEYCKKRSIIRKRYSRWNEIEDTYKKWKALIDSYNSGKSQDTPLYLIYYPFFYYF